MSIGTETSTDELPTFEPHLKIHRVMTEHTKSKFNNLIYWQIMYRNMRHLLVVLIAGYSIFFHGLVNPFTETNKTLKFYFLHSHIPNLYFFFFFLLLLNNVDCKILKKQGPALT